MKISIRENKKHNNSDGLQQKKVAERLVEMGIITCSNSESNQDGSWEVISGYHYHTPDTIRKCN